jgi:hypothetical protein
MWFISSNNSQKQQQQRAEAHFESQQNINLPLVDKIYCEELNYKLISTKYGPEIKIIFKKQIEIKDKTGKVSHEYETQYRSIGEIYSFLPDNCLIHAINPIKNLENNFGILMVYYSVKKY